MQRALPTGILLSEVLLYYLIHMLEYPQLEDVKRVANRNLLGKGQCPDLLPPTQSPLPRFDSRDMSLLDIYGDFRSRGKNPDLQGSTAESR